MEDILKDIVNEVHKEAQNPETKIEIIRLILTMQNEQIKYLKERIDKLEQKIDFKEDLK